MSEPPGPASIESLADLVGAYVAEQVDVLTEAAGPLRAGEPVVHKTRVAVRRLRSTLRVYDDLFDVPQAAALEDELVWWAGLLGAVRDLDVLAARYAAQVAALPPEDVLGPVASRVETELAAQRQPAFEAVLATLDSERYRSLLAELERWRTATPWTPAADQPAKRVKRYVARADAKLSKRLRSASRALAEHDAEAHEMLHSARKAGKRARYAVEAAAPVRGAKATKVIDDRKHLQDVLGDHNDSIVSAAFLRDLGARLGSRSGHNGFTYGLLYAHELDRQAQVLVDLKPYL